MQYKKIRIDGEVREVPADVNEVPLVLDPALTNMFNHGVRHRRQGAKPCGFAYGVVAGMFDAQRNAELRQAYQAGYNSRAVS